MPDKPLSPEKLEEIRNRVYPFDEAIPTGADAVDIIAKVQTETAKEASKQGEEKVITILEDFGEGDLEKALPWDEFNKKYGTTNEDESLVDAIRLALKKIS